jgi:hypothetical protein
MLTGEELLAGSSLTYEVRVPAELLRAGSPRAAGTEDTVRIRPLTVHDLQLVSRAAKDGDTLMAVLMVQRALVEPQLSIGQVSALSAGLLQLLLQRVNHVSGIAPEQDEIDSAVEAPLAKAAFVLAREFGWTPQQINELTLGQVLLHLQLLRQRDQRDV